MNFLQKLLKKFEICLEEIANDIEQGKYQLNEEETQHFEELRQAEYSANAMLQEALESEGSSAEPISKLKMGSLSESFESFKKLFGDEYKKLEGDGAPVPPYLGRLAELKDAFDIINTYGYEMKKASSPDTEQVRLNAVLDNPTWIKGIFNADKKADENKKPATEHWNVNEHSLMENLEKYRDDMARVHNNYNVHLQDLTGDAENPINKLRTKIHFLTDFLDDFCNDGSKINLNFIPDLFSEMQVSLNPRKVTSISQETLVCKKFFEQAESRIDETFLFGDLERKAGKKKELSLSITKEIEDEIHKLRFKPYNVGIDSNTMERMHNISTVINMPSYLRGNIMFNLNGTFTNGKVNPSKRKKHPLHGLFTKIDSIENKLKEFINSGDIGKAPTMDDYDALFASMADYVIGANQYADKRGNENANVDFIMNEARNLSNLFPNHYTDRLNRLEEKYNRKIQNEFADKYKTMCTCPLGPDENGADRMADSWNSIETLYSSHRLSKADYEKAYFVRVARDAAFRNREMRDMREAIHGVIGKADTCSIKGIRTLNFDGTNRPLSERVPEANRRYLLCKAISFEYDSAVEYDEGDRTLKDEILHSYNHKISLAFSPAPLDNAQINTLEEYYSEFINSNGIKSLTALNAEAMDKVMNEGDEKFNKVFYAGRGDVVTRFGRDAIDALTNADKGNSTEYKNLSEALRAFAKGSRNFEGASEADYSRLFEACRTYLHTHDSAPVTGEGQLRFDMTAKLMANIGLDMMEKLPDRRAEIAKEFELEMIRSISFRENVLLNAENALREDGSEVRHSIAKRIQKRANEIGAALEKNGGKGMLSGKCKDNKAIDKLTAKYSEISKEDFESASNNFAAFKVEQQEVKKEAPAVHADAPEIMDEEPVETGSKALHSVDDIMGMNLEELSEVLDRASGDKKLEFPTVNPLNGFSIPEKYVTGKTAEEIGEYFNSNADRLSDEQKQYLIGRAAGDLFFRKQAELRENREVTIPMLEKDGNIVRIPQIHLDSRQSTNLGCYSCSAALLLQSRGLELTQWQTRAYREELAGYDKARMLSDQIGNSYVLQGIATTCLPNVAAHEKTFVNLANGNRQASKEYRDRAKEEFKSIITSAIIDHKSPVSLLSSGHYVTVVGIDVKTGLLEVKNSLHNGPNPNDNEYVSIDTVFDSNNISLTWLSDIDPSNPEGFIENYQGLEYIDGKYYTNQGDSIPYFGLDEINHGKEGINFLMDGSSEGRSYISESVMLPISPIFNIDVPENVRRGNTVKKTAESPEKQELLNTLNNLTNGLFPNDAKLTGTIHSVNNNYADLRTDEIHIVNAPEKNVAKDLVKACYYTYVKDNLDVMTPYQVRHALDKATVDNMVERFEKSDTLAEIITLNGTGSEIAIDEVYKKFSEEMYVRSHDTRWQQFKDERLTSLYHEMCGRINSGNPDRYDEASVLHLNNYMRTKRNIDLEIPDALRNRGEVVIAQEPVIENENIIGTGIKNKDVIDTNPKADEEVEAGEKAKNPWDKELGRVVNLKFDTPPVAPPMQKEVPDKEVINFATSLYYTMLSKRIDLDGTSNLNSILCYREGSKDGVEVLNENVSWSSSTTFFAQGESSPDYKYLKGLYEEAKSGGLVFVMPGDTIANAKPITVGEDGSVAFSKESSPLVNSDSRLHDTKYAADNLKDAKTLHLDSLKNASENYETLSKSLVIEACRKGISSEDFANQIMTTRIAMDFDPKAKYKEYYNEGNYNKITITTVPTKEQISRKDISDAAFKNYYLSSLEANSIRAALSDMLEQGEISEKEMEEIDHSRDFLDVLFERGDSPEVINRNKERARKYLGRDIEPKDPDFENKKLQAQAEVFNARMKELAKFDYSKFYAMNDKDFVQNYPEYHRAGKVLSIFNKVYEENAKINPYINRDLGKTILEQEENYGGDYYYNTGRIRAIANPAYVKLNPMQFTDMGPAEHEAFEEFCSESNDVNLIRFALDISTMRSSKNERVPEKISRMMNPDGTGHLMKTAPLFYDEKGNKLISIGYFSYAKQGKPIYAARIDEPESLTAFRYDFKTDGIALVQKNKYANANIIGKMKASVIAVSEEKKRKALEDEKFKAERAKAEEHRAYYKDKSEEYEKVLKSSGGIRSSLTLAIKEMHKKDLSVEKYADDFANRIYKGTPKMSYDEFCTEMGVPVNERLSKEEIKHRRAVSASAAKFIFNYENNRILGNNFSAKTENVGFSFRVFTTVMCDPGNENLEKNKAKANTLINGTNAERKKLIEDRLTELMDRSDKFLGKTFTDEELLDHMKEIMQVGAAAGMEMDGFNSGLQDLEKKYGVTIDKGILDRMAQYREKIYQYNNYYVQKIDYMASQYYQYGGLDQFAQYEKIEDLIKNEKDFELARTATAVGAYSTTGIMAIADRLKDTLESDGRRIENFYDLEGKAIGTESYDLASKYHNGGDIIVCYAGDPKPQILTLEGMNSFSPKAVSKGEPETAIEKQINSKRFDDRLSAISRQKFSPARKAFEGSILNDQYKLALCMDEAGNAHPEDSAFVRDIAETLIAKLSIKRMLDQPGAPESLAETLLTDDSIRRLKEDISASGLGTEVVKALPHDMDGVLILSADALNKLITEKNSAVLEKMKNNPPLKKEDEVIDTSSKVNEDPIEAFLKEKISLAAGSEVDGNRLEEALGYFVTYGDDHNRNRMFADNGTNSRMSQIKSAILNGEKVFITIPDRKYHTLDTNEIVMKDGTPKLEIPKYEHDTMTVAVKGICKMVNNVGDIKDPSEEFTKFRNKLNELSENGIPKDAGEYYNTLNDLTDKAFHFGVGIIGRKMGKAEESLFTSVSQVIEVYRALCMHETPSNDTMHRSMIATKFLQYKLSLDIRSGNPEAKEKALSVIGDYDKYTTRVISILNSKQFKDVFKDKSSKEIEKMAHNNVEDIVKSMTKEKKKIEARHDAPERGNGIAKH